MHRYSGYPDPVWSISDERKRALQAMLASTGTPDSMPADSAVDDSLYPPLGYGGFSIADANNDVPFVTICKGIAQHQDPKHRYAAVGDAAENYVRELEAQVLSGKVPDGIEVLSAVKYGPAKVVKDMPGFGGIPEYRPRMWDEHWALLHRNNCYNYALNEPTDTFAQPGRAHDVSMGAGRVCEDVIRAACADGLRPVESPDTPLNNGHYVALVLAPEYDYHWYRLDAGGIWSHKPGHTRVRNWDNDRKPITSPETCARDPYVKFCGYFVADETGVGIRFM